PCYPGDCLTTKNEVVDAITKKSHRNISINTIYREEALTDGHGAHRDTRRPCASCRAHNSRLRSNQATFVPWTNLLRATLSVDQSRHQILTNDLFASKFVERFEPIARGVSSNPQ